MQPHEILEALSHRGYAPTLLCDDNGHWMVVDLGAKPLGGGDGEYTSFVSEDNTWYDNITDAVHAYLAETGEVLVEVGEPEAVIHNPEWMASIECDDRV